jgi:hypothetical protein
MQEGDGGGPRTRKKDRTVGMGDGREREQVRAEMVRSRLSRMSEEGLASLAAPSTINRGKC